MAQSSGLSDPEVVRECLLQAAKPFSDSFFAVPGVEPKQSLPIGAADASGLEMAAKEVGGSLDKLPRVSSSNAVVLTTGDGVPVIYARPGSDSYRDYVHRMNALFYDVDVVNSVSAYDVDHVASRSSSERLGLSYVALIATDSTANQSYASIESELCDPPDKLGLVRPNLYQIMKINNIPLLKSEGNTAAGLGIMIGEMAEQKLISRSFMMRYYGIGSVTAKRIDARIAK